MIDHHLSTIEIVELTVKKWNAYINYPINEMYIQRITDDVMHELPADQRTTEQRADVKSLVCTLADDNINHDPRLGPMKAMYTRYGKKL